MFDKLKKTLQKAIQKLDGDSFIENEPDKNNDLVGTAKEDSISQKNEIKEKIENLKPSIHVIEENKLDNTVEIEQKILAKIVQELKILSYSSVKISGINFHYKNGENSPEVIAVSNIINDYNFINKLKITLDNKSIRHTDDIKISQNYNSSNIDNCAKITPNIGIEILTPTQTNEKIIGEIIAHEGFTWEEKYTLEPIEDKIYNIGRGKKPKLDNGFRIINDIAFISLDEIQDRKYKINNYVSRSIAQIYYEKNKNMFALRRSSLMNNMQHTIKVMRLSIKNDLEEIRITSPDLIHLLKNGDQIMINDKIILEFKQHILV
uniref:hypothetical protein n=1 Tax=Ornithobacterium rhinotracheale TaxID=28251 RepID=UPI0039A50432